MVWVLSGMRASNWNQAFKLLKSDQWLSGRRPRSKNHVRRPCERGSEPDGREPVRHDCEGNGNFDTLRSRSRGRQGNTAVQETAVHLN